MSKYEKYARDLLSKMTLPEKVAQLSQKVAGYRCYTRHGEDFEFSAEFKDFIKNYGAMGAISNILRSCSWTKKDWGIGIEPTHRAKVANQLQKYVLDNSRLGIPVLIEVESNHGLQALGSEMFPTNIGMGSTFNTELYKEIMTSVGKETRLSGNHMNFVTMLDMARDPRWGRVEEFFSEDPYLASEYAKNGVEGLKKEKVLACCKHFCATGDCFGGLNTAEVSIGKRELHDIYLTVADKAVKAGADVVMVAYNTVDGIPCHANSYLLKDVLRGELGFDGIALSDGWGVERMIGQMGYDKLSGSVLALTSGIDLSLADNGVYLNLIEAVEKGLVDISYVDEAVKRILTKKYELSLFDDPFIPEDGALTAYLSSGVQKELSYKAASESMVLTKNENGILPISEKTKVALIGENADNLYYLLGSYSSLRKKGEGMSVLEAFENKFENVKYAKGWSFNGSESGFDEAINVAKDSDVIIVTLGGNSAANICNTEFDKNTGAAISVRGFVDCGEGLDTASINLPGSQIAMLRKLKELGKPMISVLIEGRPYVISEVEELSDAVLIAWYPGQQGATALADILTGKVNPSGKLSVSIPYRDTCLPCYYNRVGEDTPLKPFDSCCTNTYTDCKRRILHPFGYGLSYSVFEYKDLTVTKTDKNRFTVTAEIENVSDVGGYEVAQLYIRGFKNSIRRRGKELKGFKKVFIGAHETKSVTFDLGYDELKIYSAFERYEIENGEVEISVGSNPDLPLKAMIHTESENNFSFNK